MKKLLGIFLVLFVLGMLGLGGSYLYFIEHLPSVASLKASPLQIPLRIYSKENKLIAEFGNERRLPVAYQDLPDLLIKAVLATEDQRFFEHDGVDVRGLIRAAWYVFSTGTRVQGGSTITMQVARSFFLSPEKTYRRKINEILLARKIERELTKEEIITLYLNKIFFGSRAYGIAAAAQVYFGLTVDKLTLSQIALLIGLPQAPSKINPLVNPAASLIRRQHVLDRMLEMEFISQEAHASAAVAPLGARYHGLPIELEAPYVAEMIRNDVIQWFGKERAYTQGYKVITTLDSALQNAANGALRRTLLEYEQRHGYLGPFARVSLQTLPTPEIQAKMLEEVPRVGGLRPALVLETAAKSAKIRFSNQEIAELSWEGLSWARKRMDPDVQGPIPRMASDVIKVGDIIHVYFNKEGKPILAGIPQANGAFVAMVPQDGRVFALVGGFDYFYSNYNRVTQSYRQAGSSFKPFIYSAALLYGFTPASIVNDAPIVFTAGLQKAWRPKNYGGNFLGPMRLRDALAKSRNLVSVRLLKAVGLQPTLSHLQLFGFEKEQLPENMTLSLGSASVTPLQMNTAYAVFANGGYRIKPYYIEQIQNLAGQVIYQAKPETACEACATPASRVISEDNAYLMYSMLQQVITSGTAQRAKSLGRTDLAGKTGTTNDQTDTWFAGFNQNIVATAWLGFNQPSSLGNRETGGHTALPMWIKFMEFALKDMPESVPPQPTSVVTAKINPRTGALADETDSEAIQEVFNQDRLPQKTAPYASSGNTKNPREIMPEQLF